MKSKLKKIFKEKRTIIISILLGLILIGLIIFICTKVFHKDKEITPDDPTVSEFENYLKDAIKPFDEDTIKDFISSTDKLSTIDSIYWGAIYSDKIGNDLKIMYTLSRLIYNDSDLLSYMKSKNMFDEESGLSEVTLSIKFINKALNAKFVDTKIAANDEFTTGYYDGIAAVMCDTENCIVSVSKDKELDNGSLGSYISIKNDLTKNKYGYEITAQHYYYELDLDGNLQLDVYNNAFKEKQFCSTSITYLYANNYKLPDSCDANAALDKTKYTFDKNYRFVKSENI